MKELDELKNNIEQNAQAMNCNQFSKDIANGIILALVALRTLDEKGNEKASK